MSAAPPACLVTGGLAVLRGHRPSLSGAGHRRALMGRLDGCVGGACRRVPSPAASPCLPRIQSSAVSVVRLKGRGIVRGPPDGRCVVDGRPCGRGGVGQFSRTRSRLDRPSRLDSRAAIFRTGRRLAAPRGASDGRSVRGSGPAEEPWTEGVGSCGRWRDSGGKRRDDQSLLKRGIDDELFTARARYTRRRAARRRSWRASRRSGSRSRCSTTRTTRARRR